MLFLLGWIENEQIYTGQYCRTMLHNLSTIWFHQALILSSLSQTYGAKKSIGNSNLRQSDFLNLVENICSCFSKGSHACQSIRKTQFLEKANTNWNKNQTNNPDKELNIPKQQVEETQMQIMQDSHINLVDAGKGS